MDFNTDQQIIDAIGREYYYMILKNRKHPEESMTHKWQMLRTKWSILNRNDLL